MFKKLLICYLIIFTGCAAGRFSFAPVYNEQIAQRVQQTSNEQDTLYAKMIAAPDKHYYIYSLDYLRIEGELNTIVLADSLRYKAEKITFIVKNWRTKFLEYEADHRNRDTLSEGELRAYKNNLHALAQPAVVAEQSLTH